MPNYYVHVHANFHYWICVCLRLPFANNSIQSEEDAVALDSSSASPSSGQPAKQDDEDASQTWDALAAMDSDAGGVCFDCLVFVPVLVLVFLFVFYLCVCCIVLCALLCCCTRK